MAITLDDLRQYRDTYLSIKAIQAEIESLYYPVSSPPMVSEGGGKTLSPSDPTVQAFHQIERSKERLSHKLIELSEKKEEIDIWLNDLQDQHIASIIRFHFIVGLSWKQTCVQVYGYPDADVCRVTVNRYFKANDVRHVSGDRVL